MVGLPDGEEFENTRFDAIHEHHRQTEEQTDGETYTSTRQHRSRYI